MNNEVLFSQKTDDWSTPKSLYDKLDAEFSFNYDPCPLRSEYDGLDANWIGNVFINPPYSNVAPFLQKGLEELEAGRAKVLVYLLAARTDTKWFHKYVYGNPRAEVKFIKGRLKFGDSKNSAPFPSMLVIYK